MRIKSYKYGVNGRKKERVTASIDFALGTNAQGYDNLTEFYPISCPFFRKKGPKKHVCPMHRRHPPTTCGQTAARLD